MDISSVRVDGREADFSQVEATPDLSSDPDVTQPMKLVVVPQPSTRPKPGREFTVQVSYSGEPHVITDPDTSIEGWIPACYPLNPPRTCDGAFVVSEPMGSQGWFPSNNYPTDKATFDTLITVPQAKTALGVGELAAQTQHPDGTSTWHWTEDDPTATYLTTATVGDFNYRVDSMIETSTGRTLPLYNAIDSSATATQQAAINNTLARAPAQINFLSDTFGPYPFDSAGAVADRAAGVGYALEVQTKPHYAGASSAATRRSTPARTCTSSRTSGGGTAPHSQQWSDIWFNEGWANWSEWYWDFLVNGGDDPAAIFDDLYANTPAEDWEIAPGDPGRGSGEPVRSSSPPISAGR